VQRQVMRSARGSTHPILFYTLAQSSPNADARRHQAKNIKPTHPLMSSPPIR